jgi:hypothetical protein
MDALQARFVELGDAVGFDLLLAGEAEALLDLDLDGQAVGVSTMAANGSKSGFSLILSGPILQPFRPGLLSNLIPLLGGHWSLGVLLKESFQGEVPSGDISPRHLGHASPLLVSRGVKLCSPRPLVFDDLLLEVGGLLRMNQTGAIDSYDSVFHQTDFIRMTR